MDLVTWLLAQYTEDEELARAAGEVRDSGAIARWERDCWHRHDPDEQAGDWRDDDCAAVDGDNIHIYDEGGHGSPQAEHIARHDPAAVLADLAAKRAIVELHKMEYDRFVHATPHCGACTTGWASVEYDVAVIEWEDYPCQTLRLLGSALSHRDGYDPAWAPKV